MRRTPSTLVLLTLTALSVPSGLLAEARGKFASHEPMRSLPTPSDRPMGKSPAYFVDANKGDDGNDGSKAKPWQTIGHALKRLKPGDTLYLRGGIYYEANTVKLAGTAEKPITVRSYPGELAILDGGLREFLDDPANAWEPAPDGVKGEFRSVKVYPKLGEKVFGNFADSMVPLHGYRNLIDLRSDNKYWNIGPKMNTKKGIYCGPGVWYNADTDRIHARLAHTSLKVIGEDNYRGETDPRKLRLIIAGSRTPLNVEGGKHLRFQDLVIRGSSRTTVSVRKAEDIEFDNVVIYGGSTAMMVSGTNRLKLVNSALRGISAPWSFRAHQKYRGTAAYLLTVRGEGPPSSDFEIAHCELVDCHDGPFVGTVKGLKFHHNRVDNFNDDGIYLMSMGVGGDTHIYQNHISRCLTTFAFAGKRPTGSGVYIYRNVFDLRRPVHYQLPKSADDPRFKPRTPGGRAEVPSHGRLCSDHGGPTWEPIWFYHNTVVAADPAFRNFYGAGWGGHMKGTKRRVFNNVFVQLEGNPGLNFNPTEIDLQADYNLLWGAKDGTASKDDFFTAFRKSKLFEASKKRYPAGWAAHDRFADPKLVKLESDWRKPLDPRLQPGSPAVDAGMKLPDAWPDPLRSADKGKPDLGALPVGAEPLRTGPNP